MANQPKRLTIVVPPDMEPLLDRAKQLFYDRTHSDMIRSLLIAGLDSLNQKDQTESPVTPPADSPK